MGSGLGQTWWHGSLVKRQDSYGPDEVVFRAKEDFADWEASQAWERAKGPLGKVADEILASGQVLGAGSEVAPDLDNALVLAIIQVILEG